MSNQRLTRKDWALHALNCEHTDWNGTDDDGNLVCDDCRATTEFVIAAGGTISLATCDHILETETEIRRIGEHLDWYWMGEETIRSCELAMVGWSCPGLGAPHPEDGQQLVCRSCAAPHRATG